jgi:hypothetical protein
MSFFSLSDWNYAKFLNFWATMKMRQVEYQMCHKFILIFYQVLLDTEGHKQNEVILVSLFFLTEEKVTALGIQSQCLKLTLEKIGILHEGSPCNEIPHFSSK